MSYMSCLFLILNLTSIFLVRLFCLRLRFIANGTLLLSFNDRDIYISILNGDFIMKQFVTNPIFEKTQVRV